MELKTHLGNITLKNPVTVASGTFGYGKEYSTLIDLNALGGIFTKAVTAEPREGNPGPRVVETTAGMLNAIGLANVGIDEFLKSKLPFLKSFDTAVFVNIAGSSEMEYCTVTEKLNDVDGIAGIEVNISCPNVKHGGMAFGADPRQAFELLKKIRKIYSGFMIAKLSPNVTDITEIAGAVVDAGCDAVSLINTLVGMAVNTRARKPRLANITGGLSGPAIKPVGVAMVWKVRQKIKLPIIGIGGIMTAEDALEYIIAGASAVQIGTGIFVDPQCPINAVSGIESYLEESGIKSISEVVGTLRID